MTVLEQPEADYSTEITDKECGKETWRFEDASEHNDSVHFWLKDQNDVLQSRSLESESHMEHTFEASGTYALQTAAVSSHCADTLIEDIEVEIRPEPDVYFEAPDTIACLPGDITFENHTEHADHFRWIFGKEAQEQELASTEPVTNRYRESGIYTVELHAESQEGCRDTLTREFYIKIVDSVTADFEMNRFQGCDPLEVTFDNQSKTKDRDLSHQWFFGSGDESTRENPQYRYEDVSTGTYEVRLIADNDVCTDTAIAEVEITGFDGDEDGPVLNRATVQDENVRVEWQSLDDAADYELLRHGEDTRPIARLEESHFIDERTMPDSTMYTYNVAARDECGNRSALSNPGRNILLKGQQKDNEIALLRWHRYKEWSGGVADYTLLRRPIDGSHEDYITPADTHFTDEEYFLPNKQGYCYRIRAEQADGPHHSLSNEVCLPYSSALYVPNAFSPNQHELNDQFEVHGLGIKEYHLTIYNRWGEKVYETHDLGPAWDGTYKGEPAPEGTYLYSIQATGTEGDILNEQGTLELVR